MCGGEERGCTYISLALITNRRNVTCFHFFTKYVIHFSVYQVGWMRIQKWNLLNHNVKKDSILNMQLYILNIFIGIFRFLHSHFHPDIFSQACSSGLHCQSEPKLKFSHRFRVIE